MSITLAIMAAGIGTRFSQGCKQIAPVGPCGEYIMEYSIYDAISAGFDHIVFIIRENLEDDFKEHFGKKLEGKCKVDYAFQKMEDLPDGFVKPDERKKPWGTGHAVLAAKPYIHGPFAVINADDFYGKDAFCKMYKYLSSLEKDVQRETATYAEYAMAGFILKNTLSDNGAVTRGLCQVESDYLTGIKETKQIIKIPEGAESNGIFIDPETLVSMNMWGLTSAFMDGLEKGFIEFLNSIKAEDYTSEYLLPVYIGELLEKRACRVRVLRTDGQWFGLTYSEDCDKVRLALRKLHEEGYYPVSLFM